MYYSVDSIKRIVHLTFHVLFFYSKYCFFEKLKTVHEIYELFLSRFVPIHERRAFKNKFFIQISVNVLNIYAKNKISRKTIFSKLSADIQILISLLCTSNMNVKNVKCICLSNSTNRLIEGFKRRCKYKYHEYVYKSYQNE